MIRHITLTKILEGAEGNTVEKNAEIVKSGMEGLIRKIPGLVKCEVTLGFSEKQNLCIETVFEDMEKYEAYKGHPDHERMRVLIHKVTGVRHSFDCETVYDKRGR